MQRERRDNGVAARNAGPLEAAGHQARRAAETCACQREHAVVNIDSDDARARTHEQASCRQGAGADTEVHDHGRATGHTRVQRGRRETEHVLVSGDERADAPVVLPEIHAEVRGNAHQRIISKYTSGDVR